MPILTIDDRRIEVSEGTKIIEAAEALGIYIPRFCYHPALGSVGACRVCAVTVVEGSKKGVQMSCMLDAEDGMVVSTDHPDAVAMRRHVIEWLMLHHPHDCPVCDEGGHCLLQDMTVSGGHGLRRYRGSKRTHVDQYLGPRVQHEMNRCIQCYRCVRFYREFAGYRDLGVTGIGHRVYFGRNREGTLESPFSGNLVDICPTGVFTDKPARYFGRRWDLERGPSVCIHCSLGCAVTAGARYREMARVEARREPAVNGHFICDRGRWGFAYANAADRPRAARVDGERTPVAEARSEARSRLRKLVDAAGPGAVACMGSERTGLETLSVLEGMSRDNGWVDPVLWLESRTREAARTAASLLGEDLALSLRQLEERDCVVVLGADPLSEAPMAAVSLRQAQRRGAPVFVFDPRPVDLPLAYRHYPVRVEALPDWIRALIAAAAPEGAAGTLPEVRSFLEGMGKPAVAPPQEVVDAIRTSRRPAVVCGTDITDAETVGLAADLAALLKAGGRESGLFYLMPGANGFAAALAGDRSVSLEAVLERIESGEIRGLIVADADPMGRYPDRDRVRAALHRLELLVAIDYIETETAGAAHVFIPSATVFEAGGSWINQEGRLQEAPPVHRGGIPVSQTGGGGHPPRVFMESVPGEQASSADTLRQLGPGEYRHPLRWPGLSEGETPVETGGRIALPDPNGLRFDPQRATGPGAAEDDGRITVLAVERTFGTEALAAASPWLEEGEAPPPARIHPADAAALALADGGAVSVATPGGEVTLPVRTGENMARGTLVVPRHPAVAWRRLGATRLRLAADRFREAAAPEAPADRSTNRKSETSQ